MSFYNMMHGVNPLAGMLKAILGLERNAPPEWPKDENGEDYDLLEDGWCPAMDKYVEDSVSAQSWPVGRFRDIYLNEDGTRVILYTRNGGGNREWYKYVFKILAHHKNYIQDYDEDYDQTYAYIEFSVPENAKGFCRALATGEKPKTIHEKFMETISEIEKMGPDQIRADARFKPIVEVLEKFIGTQAEGKQ